MQSYQQTKRRKKRVLQAQITKTVTVLRGKFGYGFTISGQNPCMLSCILPGSPAHAAGLRAGDLIYFVNGENVSRACHDDVVRLVGLSADFLEIQVAENYNSSDSSDEDYFPRTKSRYPNRIRNRHSLEEKGFKQEPVSSCHTVKQNYDQSVTPYNPCEEESDLSSSLTSQDDQAWINTAWHQHCQVRPEDTQYLIEDTKKYRNEKVHSNIYSQTVTTTAKKISSAAAVVKRVPTVTDSKKHVQVGDCQSYILPQFEVSHCLSNKDNTRCSNQSKQTQNVKAIVGYIGSIETANSQTRPHQRLQTLRNTVRRLRLVKRVHTLVLMQVRPSGIFLTNDRGKQVALYPSDRIVFTGVCPDDERFFGLVTLSPPDNSNYVGELHASSSCHIFMVDPDKSPHSAHVQHAQTFQIDCIANPQTGQCEQFPGSATSLILSIARLYQDKPSRKFDSDIVQSQAFADPTSQSQHCNSGSSLGLEKDELSLEQSEQVCVVDMSSGREQLDTSSMSVDTSLMCLQNHLSSEIDTEGTPSLNFIGSPSNEQCGKPVSQPANKLTPQAMPDPTCLKLSRSNSSQLTSTVKNAENLKQNMQQLLKARHQQLKEQNCMMANNGDDEHVLSLSVSEDGHTVLEAGHVGHWRPSEATFVVPTNPAPTSIHHRSAFLLLRSTSAPIVKRSKAETVDLDARDKLSPRVFPQSHVFFRSPSAPPAPCFPHRDSDEEKDDVNQSEDDPYIRQILEQSSKDNNTDIHGESGRISEKKENIGSLVGVEKWTKMGSLRRTEEAVLKQTFSHSLEKLS